MRKLNIIIFIFLILFPISAEPQELDRSMFKSSSMVSLEVAKKAIKQVYLDSGQTRTLHCGCFFDKQKQVYPKSCDITPARLRIKDGRKILKWVHAMPLSVVADSMNCWNELICTKSDGSKFKGANCCDNISPKFKSMQSDMHNLIPSFDWAIGILGDSFGSVAFGGMEEYKVCINGGVIPEDPLAEARGNLARAYFYMSFLYRIHIQDTLEEKLRAWHFEDPPDTMEETRNSLIEQVQGNRNPFIDHPEAVERVIDF